MRDVDYPPKIRADEIARARGISRADLATAGGFHVSNLNALMLGKLKMSPRWARRLAECLECDAKDIFAPLGAPVPRRKFANREDLRRAAGLTGVGYLRRLHIVAAMLETDTEGLMRYLIYNDHGRIPTGMQRRMAAVTKEVVAIINPDAAVDDPDFHGVPPTTDLESA